MTVTRAWAEKTAELFLEEFKTNGLSFDTGVRKVADVRISGIVMKDCRNNCLPRDKRCCATKGTWKISFEGQYESDGNPFDFDLEIG